MMLLINPGVIPGAVTVRTRAKRMIYLQRPQLYQDD
jgi:hypothetical protein